MSWNKQQLFLEGNSTCFRQFLCPSSGVFSLYTQQWYMSYRYDMYTHSNGVCHTGITYTIAACTVKELLMMDKGTVWNMPSFILKIKFWEIGASGWFYYKEICHDAWSHERQIWNLWASANLDNKQFHVPYHLIRICHFHKITTFPPQHMAPHSEHHSLYPLAPNTRYICHAKCSDHQTSGVEDSIYWPFTWNSYVNSSLLHITPGVQFWDQRLNIYHCETLQSHTFICTSCTFQPCSHQSFKNHEPRTKMCKYAPRDWTVCTLYSSNIGVWGGVVVKALRY